MKEVEDINVDKFEIKDTVSKNTVTLINGMITSMSEFFGDNKAEIEQLAAMTTVLAYSSKVKSNNEQLEPNIVAQVNQSVKVLLDRMDAILAEDTSPRTSYSYRSKRAARRFIQSIVDGDQALLKNEDHIEGMYRNGTITNYPQPLFKTDLNKEYESIRDFTLDFKKYEEYMSKHPFLDQFEDRQDYEEKYRIPYIKARNAGTVSNAQRKEYVLATYEHLKRQKAYFADLLSIDTNDPEINSIYPFGKKGSVALTGDWLGSRFGVNRAEEIDREMKALENGWSPDEFEMIHNMHLMTERIISDKQEIPEQTRAQIKTIYDNFINAKVYIVKDRKALLDTIKPVYDTYKQYSNVEKNTETYKSTVGFYQKKYEEAKASTLPTVIVDADERERQELLESLQGFLKGLNKGHRVGWHSDTDEMRELKEKTRSVIALLKNNRDKNLFEDDDFRKQVDELGKKADTYNAKKREKYEKKVREELTDPNVVKGTREWKAQEEKIKNELDKFVPDTRMGETRYKNAQKLSAKCKKFVKNCNNQKKFRSEWKKYTDAGFDIARMKDFEEGGVKPFDCGIKEVLNYYSKKPAFIPEHLEFNIFDFDSFNKTCKPIECRNFSDEEFALTAFAAVHDTSMFPDDPTEDIKLCTTAESYEQKRTMYTLDLQNIHRAGAIRDFGEKIILPARNKAKEALDRYAAGDKEPLADILAKGITKVAYECIHTSGIKDRDSNFSLNTEMLTKLIGLARKDNHVYRAVQEKLDPVAKQEIQDSLNMKDLFDKCIASENKLQGAIDRKKPLSRAEKRECIRNITTYDFVSRMHDYLRDKQEREDKPYNDFVGKMDAIMQDIALGKRNDMTAGDLIIKQNQIQNDAFKSLNRIHGRLRTKAGRTKLESAIEKVTNDIPDNVSEKTINKYLDNFRKTTEDNLIKKFEADKQKSANTSLNNVKSNIKKPVKGL